MAPTTTTESEIMIHRIMNAPLTVAEPATLDHSGDPEFPDFNSAIGASDYRDDLSASSRICLNRRRRSITQRHFCSEE